MFENVFGKKKLFNKKETINAERFCELRYDEGENCPIAENLDLFAAIDISKDKKIYGVDILNYVPSKYKLKYPMELFFDFETNKLYLAAPAFGKVAFKLEDYGEIEFDIGEAYGISKRTAIGKFPIINTISDDKK